MCSLLHNTSHLLAALLHFAFFLSSVQTFMSIHAVLRKTRSFLFTFKIYMCELPNQIVHVLRFCVMFQFFLHSILSPFIHSFALSFFFLRFAALKQCSKWNKNQQQWSTCKFSIPRYSMNSKLQFYRKCYLAFDLSEWL